MTRLGLSLFVTLGLAGCLDVPAAEPVSVPLPEPELRATAEVSAPRSTRVVARDFVAVVNIMEPVAERECRQRAPRLNCDFLILVDDRPDMPPNAFQTEDEDGRPIIAMTLSLLADTRNRDEIAFVLAHEAAHHIAGHLEQQRRNAAAGAERFGELADTLGTTGTEGIRTAQELGALVGTFSYSQDFELEADRLGTIITAKAGFDPVLGSEFFFRIPDPADRFLSTHPPTAARVEMVRRTAAGL